jgi:hypothetical protein
MNNPNQFENDFSNLNADLNNFYNYRQNTIRQGKVDAMTQRNFDLGQSTEKSSLSTRLKSLAGEEGIGALATPHGVQQIRSVVNYARGKFLSPETVASQDEAAASSYQAAEDAVVAGVRGVGSGIASGVSAVGEGLASGASAIGSGLSQIGSSLTRGAGEMGDVGGDAVIQSLNATEMAPVFSSGGGGTGIFAESKVAPPPVDETGNYIPETAAERSARMQGTAPEASEEVVDYGAIRSAEPAVAEGTEAVAETGATEAAGAVGAGTLAADTAVTAGLEEAAAGSWWSPVGWVLGAAGLGYAAYTYAEGEEQQKESQEEQTAADQVKPNTPPQTSIAGRYISPVQNAMQDE